jgi:hypothetical protein
MPDVLRRCAPVSLCLLALAGCGDGSPLGAGGESSTSSSGGATATSSSGAPTSVSSSSSTAAAATTSTGAGGGKDPHASSPPPGTSLCGSASFTPAEAAAACAAPATFSTLYPDTCGTFTTTGGRWEAWCDPSGLAYFWIELDDAKVDASPCAGVGEAQDRFELERNGSGDGPAPFPTVSSGIDSSAVDVGYGYQVPFPYPTGTGRLWVGESVQCPDLSGHIGRIAGAEFAWHMP